MWQNIHPSCWEEYGVPGESLTESQQDHGKYQARENAKLFQGGVESHDLGFLGCIELIFIQEKVCCDKQKMMENLFKVGPDVMTSKKVQAHIIKLCQPHLRPLSP